jgi:hypothetical protein
VTLREARFLIPDRSGHLLATHDGMPSVLDASASLAASRREVLGGTPTSSVNRVLNVPSDEQPTAKRDVGHGHVAAPQRHRPLDTAGHQVAVWRFGRKPP